MKPQCTKIWKYCNKIAYHSHCIISKTRWPFTKLCITHKVVSCSLFRILAHCVLKELWQTLIMPWLRSNIKIVILWTCRVKDQWHSLLQQPNKQTRKTCFSSPFLNANAGLLAMLMRSLSELSVFRRKIKAQLLSVI